MARRCCDKKEYKDIEKLSYIEQEFYATKFCEGNNGLKELLLFLWQNNIATFSCCAGHKSIPPRKTNNKVVEKISPAKKETKATISFSLKTFSNNQINVLLKNLFCTFKTNTEYYFQNINNFKETDKKITINFEYEIRKSCFYILLEIIKDSIENIVSFNYSSEDVFHKTLIDDIMLLYNFDFKKYNTDNPLQKVTAFQLRYMQEDVLFGFKTQETDNEIKFSNNKKLFNQKIDGKFAYECVGSISPNTYCRCKDFNVILCENKFKIVDLDYIVRNKLIEFWDYLISLNSFYTHDLFIYRLQQAQNHNLYK